MGALFGWSPRVVVILKFVVCVRVIFVFFGGRRWPQKLLVDPEVVWRSPKAANVRHRGPPFRVVLDRSGWWVLVPPMPLRPAPANGLVTPRMGRRRRQKHPANEPMPHHHRVQFRESCRQPGVAMRRMILSVFGGLLAAALLISPAHAVKPVNIPQSQ
jgi:hypothetical protein